MKQIIAEDGNIYYIKFRRDFISWLHLDVYIKETHKFLFFKYKTRFKIGTKQMGSDKCLVSDIEMYRLKSVIKDIIVNYDKRNTNSNKLDQWDGYLGKDGDVMKKKLMRDKKIKDLLKGDSSKLEDFLNND